MLPTWSDGGPAKSYSRRKSIFGPAIIVDLTSRLEFNNSRIVTSQKAAFFGGPLPERLMKAARNVEVSFRGKAYQFP